jgi:hypothetical protein
MLFLGSGFQEIVNTLIYIKPNFASGRFITQYFCQNSKTVLFSIYQLVFTFFGDRLLYFDCFNEAFYKLRTLQLAFRHWMLIHWVC